MNKTQIKAAGAVIIAEMQPQPHTEDVAVALWVVKTKLREYDERSAKVGARWTSQDLKVATQKLQRVLDGDICGNAVIKAQNVRMYAQYVCEECGKHKPESEMISASEISLCRGCVQPVSSEEHHD
jgi:predicted RNA-binding Zn-ribbon protein involved in translation (DUF1610 family)